MLAPLKDERAQNVNMGVPISEAVTEISRVEYQSAFSRFYEVGRNLSLYT